MLGIQIKNEFIELFANSSISFELNSQLFLNDDPLIIRGSYSFPFNVPASTTNRSILGSPDYIDNTVDFIANEPANVYVDGIFYFPATAHIKVASKDQYEVFLIINTLELLKAVPLNEIDLGGDRSIGPVPTDHAKLTAENPLDYDYCFFPVYNDAFWDLETEPEGIFKYVQNPYDSINQIFREDEDSLVAMPFVKLEYLLDRLFTHFNLSLINDFQINEELKKIFLYNNYSIYNADGEWDDTINLQNHVSKKAASEFIKGIAKNFCLGIFPNAFNSVVRMVPLMNLIDENHSYDWTDKAAQKYTVTTDKSLPGKFCYEKTIDQMDSNSLEFPVPILAEVDTVGEAVGLGGPGYYYVVPWNTYVYIPLSTTETEVNQKTQICIDLGNEADDIESQVGAVYMDQVAINIGNSENGLFRDYLMPRVKVPGTFTTISDRNQAYDMPDKLVFYRDFQYNDALELYPFASNNVYMHLTNMPIPGLEYSLLWDREYGLYEKWWKNWFEFLKNKKDVIRKLNLTISDLLNFSFDKKVRIENMDYFVRQMTITINANGLQPVDAKLVPIA